MVKKEEMKEQLIEVTKKLIEESDGDVDKITVRSIAVRAGVGVGLINYHFGTKESLIEKSVQSMIGDTILLNADKASDKENDFDEILEGAEHAMKFFFDHPEVSRISMTGDLLRPQLTDNTMKTIKSVEARIVSIGKEEKEARLLSFAIVSFMQSVFLHKEVAKEFIGYEIEEENERRDMLRYILGKFLKK